MTPLSPVRGGFSGNPIGGKEGEAAWSSLQQRGPPRRVFACFESANWVAWRLHFMENFFFPPPKANPDHIAVFAMFVKIRKWFLTMIKSSSGVEKENFPPHRRST